MQYELEIQEVKSDKGQVLIIATLCTQSQYETIGIETFQVVAASQELALESLQSLAKASKAKHLSDNPEKLEAMIGRKIII